MTSIFGRATLRTSRALSGHRLTHNTQPASIWSAIEPSFLSQPRPLSTAATVKSKLAYPQEQLWSELTAAEAASKSVATQTPTRTITMVKKLMPDGSPCRKCSEIQERLERDGLHDRIDSVLYMNPNAPGVDRGTQMAMQYGVKTAPFFIVRTHLGGQDAVREDVYTAYLRMKKQVFGRKASVAETDNDVAMSIY